MTVAWSGRQLPSRDSEDRTPQSKGYTFYELVSRMSAEYKEGQVAQLLFCKTDTQKKEKNKKKIKKLEKMFTVSETSGSNKRPSRTIKKFAGTSSLRPLSDSTSSYKMLYPPVKEGFCPSPSVVHESLQNESEEQKRLSKKRKLAFEEAESGKTKHKKGPRDTSDDYRTVFIGSLPNQVTTKTLKQLFTEYGKINSVRLRGAISDNEKLPKRAIIIKKKFHPNVNTLSGYVVFENRDSAIKATQLNGTEMDGHMLRVDMADQAHKHQHKKCVFVGNLPYNIMESMIRSHFTDCGEIVDIRVIRDKATGKGKGFAYVRFIDSSSVSLALKLDESTLGGRQIRIRRSMEEGSKHKKKNLRIQRQRSENGKMREHKNTDSRKNAAERVKKGKTKLDTNKQVFRPKSTKDHNFKKPKTFKHNKRMRLV